MDGATLIAILAVVVAIVAVGFKRLDPIAGLVVVIAAAVLWVIGQGHIHIG